MRRFVDLHTHSTASDGTLSPAEVVRIADRESLYALALCDHDTIEGLAEARAAAEQCPELRFINGMEVSAIYPSGTMHILALGFEPAAAPILGLAERFQSSRRERNPKIIQKLQALGLPISMDDVLAAAHAAPGQERIIGRMHIAEALVAKGMVSSTQEAFDKYIADGRPAYVGKEKLAAREVIGAIRDSGGLAVLAHPVQLHCENRSQLETVIRGLAADGLAGIEAFHTEHSPEQTRLYMDIARRLGLGVTGGSDFHGDPKPHVRIGRPRVAWTTLGQGIAQRLFGKKE